MEGIILLEGRSEKMEINAETIYEQTKGSLNELLQLDRSGLNPAQLLVIGASSSEIAGGVLGHNSTYVFDSPVKCYILRLQMSPTSTFRAMQIRCNTSMRTASLASSFR